MKIAVFISGVVTGIIAIIFIGVLISAGDQSSTGLPGLTMYPEKGECIATRGKIEVFQVLRPSMALAQIGDSFEEKLTVLLINYDGKHYYDDQKIKIPVGKCARQRGTFKYTTKNYGDKTVPAVVIEKY